MMPVRPGDERLNLAREFLAEQMLTQHRSKAVLYRHCGLSPQATVSNSDWLAFSALLTGDSCHPAMCGALRNYIVRTTGIGGSVAYQFVQDDIDSELSALCSAAHLVLQYAPDLTQVEVWGFSGATFARGIEGFGGREFLLQSRFSDPEVEFTPQWLAMNAVPMLFFHECRVVFVDHRLWESEDFP